MRRGRRRWGVHSTLYAADPWAVISDAVREQISAEDERRAAQSFVRQGREYFNAAERAASIETQPLLHYYAFLNLAKAMSMARGRADIVGKVGHGVNVVGGTGHTPATAELSFGRSSATTKCAVDELHRSLESTPVPTAHAPIKEIIAQSVVGHRLWCGAVSRRERFLSVGGVQLLEDRAAKSIWARILVDSSTMKARGRGLTETALEGGLGADFTPVKDVSHAGNIYRVFEQRAPVSYSHRASDHVVEVVDRVRPILWQTITAAPPYRRFYLYLSPPGETRLPQWMSVYSTLFWLGSLTRYQPVELLNLLESKHGAFFREFLATQPSQLLYCLASEFKRQNVSKASVV